MQTKAQEEMVGFAIIIVIVAVIMLVFLAISFKGTKTEVLQSYEVENFIQTVLQYNTDCADYLSSHLSIKEVIIDCYGNKECLDGRKSCEVLEENLNNLVIKSWDEKVGSKGYKLEIVTEDEALFVLEKGNETNNFKGAMEEFSKLGDLIKIYFNVYY